MPTEFIHIPPIQSIRNRNPSFSHCRFNLLGDTNSMAQPAQIERYNKRMANSLSCGHESPRRMWLASCSSYYSLGTRWKGSRTGCPASLSKYIVIGECNFMFAKNSKAYSVYLLIRFVFSLAAFIYFYAFFLTRFTFPLLFPQK